MPSCKRGGRRSAARCKSGVPSCRRSMRCAPRQALRIARSTTLIVAAGRSVASARLRRCERAFIRAFACANDDEMAALAAELDLVIGGTRVVGDVARIIRVRERRVAGHALTAGDGPASVRPCTFERPPFRRSHRRAAGPFRLSSTRRGGRCKAHLPSRWGWAAARRGPAREPCRPRD